MKKYLLMIPLVILLFLIVFFTFQASKKTRENTQTFETSPAMRIFPPQEARVITV